MTLLLASIPVMLIAIGAATVPLIKLMHHEHQLHSDEIAQLEAIAEREAASVAA